MHWRASAVSAQESSNNHGRNEAEQKVTLGPRGEVPLTHITDQEKDDFAVAYDLSQTDAEFVLGKGGGTIVELTTQLADDDRYGSIWVESTLQSCVAHRDQIT